MRKTGLAIVAALLVAAGGAAAALYLYTRPTLLRVAVPKGTGDYRLMTAAAHVLAKQREVVRLDLIPVPDPAASAAALESEAVDLAVLRADVALPASAQALVILHRNATLLVAPGGSKLRRVADLRGRRIGVVHETPGSEANARLLETILAQYDMPMKQVTLASLTPSEVRAAIEEKKVDVIFAVAVPQSGPITSVVDAIAATSSKAPVFIPITAAKAISKRFPALEPMEVVQGAFGGDPPRPESAFETSSLAVLLGARGSLENAAAAELTRFFFSHRATIALSAPLANLIEAPSTEKSAPLPVHQGAADYLQGNVESFFEKYSDLFYIGAMLLSLVGSGAAALASRFNIRTHERTEQMTERLLEILQAARGGATWAELDGYEREVDEVLVRTIGDRRLRGADASGLHVMALALDQTRRAIAERRKALTSNAQVKNFPARKDAAERGEG